MIYWFSILYFILVCLATGYTVAALCKINKTNMLESISTFSGLGLAAFVVLIYLFNIIGIPLRYEYFLLISIIFPVYKILVFLYKKNGQDLKKFIPVLKNLVIKKRHIINVAILIIFSVTLYMYLKGSFAYPYLEDGDPYLHTLSAEYVKERHTFSHDKDVPFTYMLPYPPAYTALMGVLLQTNGDVVWTLKFFNALILSLSILWFFHFAKQFTKSGSVALFATFVLASIPAYLSHFIFAHSLGVSLMPVGMYLFMKTKDEGKNWCVPLALAVAANLIIQATVSVVFGLFLTIFFAITVIFEKKLRLDLFLSLVIGLVLALALFWVPDMIAYGGFKNIITSGSDEKLWAIGLAASSNQYIFSAKDFLFTKLTGGIDTQIGIGFFACILAIFGVSYFLFTLLRKKTRSTYRNQEQWVVTTFILLIITFLGVNGARLPIRLVPLRWWAFFAFPFAIFSAYSILKLTDLSKKRVTRYLIILVFIVGIIFTSFISRYTVQTAQWPPHVWSGFDELKGYLALRDKPYDNIFPLCSPDLKLSFINKLSFLTNDISRDKGYFEFKAEAFNKTPKETHNFLLKNNLKYVLIDSTCVKDFGMNTTNDKIREMQESGLFAGEFSTPGAILIKPV